ncbi:MAG: MFS transporter [Robiginitomaculum sp.]
MSNPIQLITARRFAPLFFAQLFGAFNDQFLKMALITIVTWGSLDVFGLKPAIIVPIAGTVFTLPFFFGCALAGQVSDKYDKALVLLRVKQAEILIMILAAIGFLLESSTLLLLTLAMMGAQSAFFSPTRNAVLPQWLKPKELITGNALINGFVAVSILLGQVLGVLLIMKTGGPKFVAAILLIFAILGWLAIRPAPPAPSENPDVKINYNLFTEIFHTLGFAYRDQKVFKPMLGTAWYYWLSAGVLILMPAFIKENLHYDSTVLVLVLAIFTVGALIGAFTCMAVPKRKESIGVSAVGAMGVAIFTFDMYLVGNGPHWLGFDATLLSNKGEAILGTAKNFIDNPDSRRFMIGLFGSAISASLFVIPLNAMAQSRATPMHRAKLLAAGALMINVSTSIVQLLIAGMGYTSIPMHFPFLVISIISALIAVYALHRARLARSTP